MAPIVTAIPAIFVAATYRLAPRCRWPAQREDALQVLQWVEREAERLGGDPGRIAVAGHSAGGHLAACVAVRQRGSALRACLPVSAPFDLQYGNVSPESREARVYRYLLQTRSQDRDASPLAFVHRGCAPFHIVWGEADFPHVAASSRAMVSALAEEGVLVSSSTVPGASHFHTHLGLADRANPWYVRLRELLA